MATTFSKKATYQLSRLKKFLKTFVGKAMGILGLVVIASFVITALGASFIAKYDPIRDKTLAAPLAAPLWLRQIPPYLGGNPKLSENYYVVSDQGFDSPNSLQEWTKTTNSTAIMAEYEPNLGHISNGSVHISYSRNPIDPPGNSTFVFCKRFTFPYTGPPGEFYGSIALFFNGTGFDRVIQEAFYNPVENITQTQNVTLNFFDVPVEIKLFMGRADNINWTLWPLPEQEPPRVRNRVAYAFSGNWTWSSATGLVATGNQDFNKIFRLTVNNDAVPTLFPKGSLPADYYYGVQLTFLDSNTFSSENQSKLVKTDVYLDDLGMKLAGTAWGLLGTDQHGRDLFSQLIYGSRLSLYVGLLSAFISVVLGLIVGLLAGYLGRVIDELLMRLTDMLLVIPALPLLIVISAVLGTSLENLILVLGFLGWMGFARLVRSQVLSLKERPFIEAAKAAGAGRVHILTAHILPNVASLVYVSLATAVPGAVVAEAALSFLGFTDPWRVSWGKMLADAQEAQAWANWWWVVPPGLSIALLSMAFIFLGYALDEVLNPRLRVRR